MKRIIMLVLLFAALKVAGQTTGYFRFDTVKIMKQNGTCELYLINKTKDSLGILTNVGGGLTQFKRPRALSDSTFVVGNDTLRIIGRPGTTLTNASATGDTLLISNQIKRLNPGYGITHTIAAGNITQRVDTTTGKIATQRAVRDSMMLAINNISLVSRLDFIHEGANSTTYQNDTLIGKQIIFFTIESYPVGFIERSNSIWCEFDSETGTITLTNGAFYNDDHVIILYRTTPIFLLDENGTPVRDENGNFIILN